jgi:CBS domain containing-hemolysin-like protein
MALPEAGTIEEVMKETRPLRYARIPVYRTSVDEVTGYVTRFELTEAYRAGETDAALAKFRRPIQAVPEQASVATTLELMLRNREHILLVVDEYGGLEGIVTLEDAIETLLGIEIVDESDATADLQTLARSLAQSRRSHEDSDTTRTDKDM